MNNPEQPLAGWYPDPQTAGTLRWWDGGQWTSHIQPDWRTKHLVPGLQNSHYAHQRSSPAVQIKNILSEPIFATKRSRTTAIVISAAVAFIIVAILVGSKSGIGMPGRHPYAVKGNQGEWLDAVCRPGHPIFENAPMLESLGGARCFSKPFTKGGEAGTIISADKFPSVDAALGFISIIHGKYYAIGVDKAGTVTAFFLYTEDRVVLEPLTRFGFKIEHP